MDRSTTIVDTAFACYAHSHHRHRRHEVGTSQKQQRALVANGVDKALLGGAVKGFRVAVPLELLRAIAEYSSSLLDWCPQLTNQEVASIDPHDRSVVRFDHPGVSILDFYGRDHRPFAATSECEFAPGHVYTVTMRTTCPPGFHMVSMGFRRNASLRSCTYVGVVASTDADKARNDTASLFRHGTFLPEQWCTHGGAYCTTHLLKMTVDLSDTTEGVLTYEIPEAEATGGHSSGKIAHTRVPLSSDSLRLLVHALPGTSAQILDTRTVS